MKYIFIIFVILFSFLRISSFSSGYAYWGDDFAQYIHHAVNLAKGINYSDTGYIFNLQSPLIGPQVYPPGYPIILSPLIFLFGLNFLSLKILNVLLFEIFILIIFFLTKEAAKNEMLALFIALFLQTSSSFLYLETWIMPEFLLLLCVYLMLFLIYKLQTDKSKKSISLEILLYFVAILTSLTHPIGLLITGGLSLYTISVARKNWIVGIGLLIIAILSIILYQRLGVIGYYSETNIGFSFSSLKDTYLENVIYYFQEFRTFLGTPFTKHFSFLNTFYSLLFPMIAAIYAIHYLLYNRRSSLINLLLFLLLFHTQILFFWDFRQGVRYLLPSIPIIIIFFFLGIEKLTKFKRKIAFLGVAVLILLQTLQSRHVLKPEYDLFADSKNRQFLSYFAKFNRKTVVVFEKPRLLSLMTPVSSLAIADSLKPKENLEIIRKNRTCFIVSHKLPKDIGVERAITSLVSNTSLFTKVLENDDFIIFKFRDCPEG